tara:strand:+ start:5389 stop:5553 length:165 start_codon:yes stop_codon:yes gene_type:complete
LFDNQFLVLQYYKNGNGFFIHTALPIFNDSKEKGRRVILARKEVPVKSNDNNTV